MQVKDILRTKTREVVTTPPETSVRQAMELLLNNRVGCLPVVDDSGRLRGIISDKDIFKRAYKDPGSFQGASVGELMTTDLIVGVPDDEIGYIAGIMTNNRIRHIPIVERDRLVGLVSIGDVAKTQMDDIKTENRYLKQYLNGSYPG
ncbi:MAG TPA: CBS domain-containing protein [Acidobacteriota bacterium]|nr:CBS domain-containing protein [Acidobacteriota bacterium]